MGIVPPRPIHPRGGQKNTALLALMKSIETEIAQRQRIAATEKPMQLVPYEELERYSTGNGGGNA